MPTQRPLPKTRSDVYRLELKSDSKAVLLWLLDRPARVYERAEIAEALGMKAAAVEVGMVRLQRRTPFLLEREGPHGEVLRGRHGYLGPQHPLRAAWAVSESASAPEPPYAPPHGVDEPGPLDSGPFVIDPPAPEPDTDPPATDEPPPKSDGRFKKKPKPTTEEPV